MALSATIYLQGGEYLSVRQTAQEVHALLDQAAASEFIRLTERDEEVPRIVSVRKTAVLAIFGDEDKTGRLAETQRALADIVVSLTPAARLEDRLAPLNAKLEAEARVEQTVKRMQEMLNDLTDPTVPPVGA